MDSIYQVIYSIILFEFRIIILDAYFTALQKLGGVRPDPVLNSLPSQQNSFINQPFSGQRQEQQQRPGQFNDQRQQQRPGQFNDQRQQQQRPDQRPPQFPDQRPQQQDQRPQQQPQRQVRRPLSTPAESLLTRAIQTFARLF